MARQGYDRRFGDLVASGVKIQQARRLLNGHDGCAGLTPIKLPRLPGAEDYARNSRQTAALVRSY